MVMDFWAYECFCNLAQNYDLASITYLCMCMLDANYGFWCTCGTIVKSLKYKGLHLRCRPKNNFYVSLVVGSCLRN